MRVIGVKRLRDFWTEYAGAEAALKTWIKDAGRADWKSRRDIKSVYANASFGVNNRVAFKIRKDTYLLMTRVNYSAGIVHVRFIGAHWKHRVNTATV